MEKCDYDEGLFAITIQTLNPFISVLKWAKCLSSSHY